MLNDISSSSLADKIDNLRQTRDLLLPKLISGEIDVSDLDIKMREPAWIPNPVNTVKTSL